MTGVATTRIEQAHALVDEAIDRFVTIEGKELAATVILFSGGKDSTVLAHLMRTRATHLAHCNTTVGIEATRQFVRDSAKTWGLPLIEMLPPVDYRTLVIERGFPGPGQHWKMYQRLKERSLRLIRKQLVTNGRRQRVLFLAGRRRDESTRRMSVPDMEREGSVVWCSPLVKWTNEDMAIYSATHDLPHNEVTDHLHMSGECLCGAFAKAGEMEEIAFWYPEMAAELRQLEVEVAARHPEPLCRWGWGGEAEVLQAFRAGRLCSSCEVRAFTEAET